MRVKFHIINFGHMSCKNMQKSHFWKFPHLDPKCHGWSHIVIYRSEMEDQTVVFNYASNLYMSNHWISMKLYIKKTWLFFLRQGILFFASVIFDNVENPQRNYNCCIREVSSPINFHQPDCAIFFIEKNKCINVKRFWNLCIFI